MLLNWIRAVVCCLVTQGAYSFAPYWLGRFRVSLAITSDNCLYNAATHASLFLDDNALSFFGVTLRA